MGSTEWPPSDSSLAVRLFGTFQVWVDGQPLPHLRTRKRQWLLALLVLRHDRQTEREWLAATLWPDSSEQQALANLRLSLYDVRAALGSEAGRILAPSPRTLRLDLSNAATADVVLFDAAVARGDPASLEKAVALYRGPLLENCLEEWALGEREARGQAYLGALESLAAHALGEGDATRAAGYLRRAVAADPLRESAQRALLTALARGGNHAAAVLAYRDFRVRLSREMAAEPDPETQAVYQQIRADARRRAAPQAAPAPASPDDLAPEPPPNNLPPPRTSFVGRRRVADEVRGLLVPSTLVPSTLAPGETRLVTLTGAGGAGKTRLALRVAGDLLERFPDGVWFVDLAPLADPSLVPQAVASALGAREEPGRPLAEVLEDHLCARALLLVLDNCEHLLDACARFTDRLLLTCRHLRILATSRERLRVAGEIAYRVPSLEFPAGDEGAVTVEDALDCEAVRLFVERAVASQPAFALTTQNVAAVVRVCRRLDGSPLAIELAAARTNVLSAEQIAGRLDDRFRLLTGGSRAALPRQQTLRAAIDWSHDLLDAAEQALLRRLAVFAGGCTLESAEAVCADREARSDVVAVLGGLVEKSMVVAEEDRRAGDGMRYRLLDSVRHYGLEKLADAGEADGVRRQHLLRFLHLAEQADLALWGEDGPAWAQRLDAEHDNLRAALEYAGAAAGDEGEAGMRLAGALAQYWYLRGHWTEGREWLEGMLRTGHGRPTIGRARALLGAGILAWNQDDYRRARPFMEEGVAVWRQVGDTMGLADTVLVLGSVLGTQGEFDDARRLLQESLELYGRIDSLPARIGAVFALAYLGRVAFEQEDFAAAHAVSEACMARSREIGHRWGLAFAHLTLGSVAANTGDLDGADAHGAEALVVSEMLGNQRGMARCQLLLGQVARRRGQLSEARRRFGECLHVFQELGEKEGVCYALEEMALLSALSGEAERAVRLLASAGALRAAAGIPLPPVGRAVEGECRALARSALGEAAFTRAWTAGSVEPPAPSAGRAPRESDPA